MEGGLNGYLLSGADMKAKVEIAERRVNFWRLIAFCLFLEKLIGYYVRTHQ